ncbi:Ig-like domain-containing protein [Geomonas sp. Red32]|uniref:Ig-like domain-containing protein n=1 Tax=Geomonas sp. Red32 TaxID=2912856 RepID=UPI00202CB746|nr:Ig-like domain-containing protein [Geomonas sp. Red32]MCM0083376.1 Ig-like domain-containing protein [Geomonas sp. Red32]
MRKTIAKGIMKTMLTLALLVPTSALAATYYVDPNAASDSGNGSATSPKKYVSSGISLMGSGDTLILKDGVYTGDANMISEYSSIFVLPPSGSAGNFTTIKAEHVGQAIIDSQYKYLAVSNINTASRKRDYVHFDGIHFRNGGNGLFIWYGDHAWISNCGFQDGMPANVTWEVPIAAIAGGSSYGLVEDCWVWGYGRYGFYTKPEDYNGNPVGTNHMIFRRIVVRMDNTPAQYMTAGLRFYGSDTNVMQNNIIIDGNWNSSSGEFHGMATGGGSSASDKNDSFISNIVLNNPLIDCYWSEKGTGTHTVTNNVCWDNDMGLHMSQDFSSPFTVNSSYNTIGANSYLDVRQNYGFALNHTHDLFYTVNGADTFFDGNGTETWSSPVSVYLASGAAAGRAGSYSTFSAGANLYTQGLKYLPRIESGSTLASAGVGATIMYQLGGTGVFYGDANWNSVSSTPLWPYANEQMWAAKLASYNATGPGGNRGFAALATSSATPLTDYIWGYLGNAKPDIYGTGAPVADTTAPTASISSPAAGATVSGTVSIGASASDNVGVTKVELYVDGALAASDTASPYSFSWASSAVANGSHTLLVKAYDAAGNVGQGSISVNVQNISDTTAPVVSISSPATGSTVSGSATVAASASDNVGVTKVEFYLNGALAAAVNTAPYSFNWSTTSYANGSFTVSAKAYDAAGNVGSTSGVTVTVANVVADTTAPAIGYFVMPSTASSLTVPVTSFSATDNVAVTGYLITESSTKPSASASGWSAAAPASFTFSAAGTRNAYGWAKDAAGNVSASKVDSVMITLPVANATTSIAVDKTVYRDSSSTSRSIASPTLTTSGSGRLLVAFITGSAPSSGSNSYVSSVTNSGTSLKWTKAVATAVQRGTSEIWYAWASSKFSGTVTANLNQSVSSRSITVMAFTGTATGSAAIGAVSGGNSASGAPNASLTTTKANSLVVGTGNDWSGAVARTVGSGQKMVHQFLSPTSDTYWVQMGSAVASTGTGTAINDTAPAADMYNLSIVEIRTP